MLMAETTPGIDTATIAVSDPVALRDYFLRLGAAASVDDGGGVRVELALVGVEKDFIADHLRRWVAANGTAATMTFEPPAAVAPVPVPAPQAPVPVPAPVAAPAAPAVPLEPAAFFLERPRLGDLLLRKGLITQDQLEQALNESRTSGDLLGRVMIRRQFIFEDELARTLAAQLDIPYVNLRVAGYDRAVAQMLPSREGMRIAALPIGVLGGRIRVVLADPSDEHAKALLRQYVGDFTLAVTDLSEIELAWRTLDPTCAIAQVA
jgi:hypothetical protein